MEGALCQLFDAMYTVLISGICNVAVIRHAVIHSCHHQAELEAYIVCFS